MKGFDSTSELNRPGSSREFDVPCVSRSRVAGLWLCYGFDLVVAEFVFDRGEHAEGGVAPTAVMEDLEVFEDRVGEFEAGFSSAGG